MPLDKGAFMNHCCHPNLSSRPLFKKSRLPWGTLPLAIFCVTALICTVKANLLHAQSLTLKNGVTLEGGIGRTNEIGGIASDATNAPVIFVDDDLRRTFVSFFQVATPPIEAGRVVERIKIEQRVAPTSSRIIGGVGEILHIGKFDLYGRRQVTIPGPRGPIIVYQGITEVSPKYCRVEGLHAGKTPYRWEMRIDTNSVPREVLSSILRRQFDADNSHSRLRIVDLYRQAERYRDAIIELKGILQDFPELSELEKQVDILNQAQARKWVQEIKQRGDAGQYQLVQSMIAKFPSKGIAGEILGEVLEIRREYGKQQELRDTLTSALDRNLNELLANSDMEEAKRARLEAACSEIKSDLNRANLSRLDDFYRFIDDSTETADQKVSLALSGWLLGSSSGIDNLAVTLSIHEVRDVVIEYLSTKDVVARQAALEKLESMEGSTPEYLAKLIKHIKPPRMPGADVASRPGFFEMTCKGISGEPDIEYLVQLPPEYDPYRKYPCVITLNGLGTTPEKQIDWWAGTYSPQHGMCMGQAARQGYIVIAPRWLEKQQAIYHYSAQEHASVLFSLQSALQEFSIDTDRVFLSGHSLGGSAVWDIGLAHPDLWAGVIPIVASADKYVSLYWNNIRNTTPFYFVHGGYDFSRLATNKMDWNRYLKKANFDTMIVEYLGRGHEHFHEEVHRIFDWMEKHERDFTPKEFSVSTLRPWDTFFWWVELEEMPETTISLPAEWPGTGSRPGKTDARILKENTLSVSSSANRVTVWLSPDLIDFSKRVTLNRKSYPVQPDRVTLLEDVRQRGDRQHPFWAKAELVRGTWQKPN